MTVNDAPAMTNASRRLRTGDFAQRQVVASNGMSVDACDRGERSWAVAVVDRRQGEGTDSGWLIVAVEPVALVVPTPDCSAQAVQDPEGECRPGKALAVADILQDDRRSTSVRMYSEDAAVLPLRSAKLDR